MSPVEETHQDIIASKLDLAGVERDPQSVGRYKTSNIFTRALAYLIGTTGRASRVLRCGPDGVLHVREAPLTDWIRYGYGASTSTSWVDTGDVGDLIIVSGIMNAPDMLSFQGSLDGTTIIAEAPFMALGLSHGADDVLEGVFSVRLVAHVRYFKMCMTDGGTVKMTWSAFKAP